MEHPKSYPVYVYPVDTTPCTLHSDLPFCVQVSEAKLVYVHDLACTIHCVLTVIKEYLYKKQPV